MGILYERTGFLLMLLPNSSYLIPYIEPIEFIVTVIRLSGMRCQEGEFSTM